MFSKSHVATELCHNVTTTKQSHVDDSTARSQILEELVQRTVHNPLHEKFISVRNYVK
jgi:inhibitor of KinA sporulation pathway (predicted exonuclease)